MNFSYSTRKVVCNGIKPSRVDRGRIEVLVSKDPALHKKTYTNNKNLNANEKQNNRHVDFFVVQQSLKCLPRFNSFLWLLRFINRVINLVFHYIEFVAVQQNHDYHKLDSSPVDERNTNTLLKIIAHSCSNTMLLCFARMHTRY